MADQEEEMLQLAIRQSLMEQSGGTALPKEDVSTTEISEQLGHAVTLDTQHALFFVGIDEAKPLCRGIKARIDGTLYQVLSIRNSDGMAEISLCLA